MPPGTEQSASRVGPPEVANEAEDLGIERSANATSFVASPESRSMSPPLGEDPIDRAQRELRKDVAQFQAESEQAAEELQASLKRVDYKAGADFSEFDERIRAYEDRARRRAESMSEQARERLERAAHEVEAQAEEKQRQLLEAEAAAKRAASGDGPDVYRYDAAATTDDATEKDFAPYHALPTARPMPKVREKPPSGSLFVKLLAAFLIFSAFYALDYCL